tara:strand:+ start:292 stop:1320 length:1029 start_codon:yes stop_codon:yes gene_type:complete
MDNLIIDLFNKNIIYFENNTIHVLFNNLISYPYIVNTIVKFIYDKIKFIEYTNIIGLSHSLMHLASILSYNHNIPLLILNKHKLINGMYEDNNSVIVLNDSKNLLRYISILESNKLNIKYIFNIYNDNRINIDNYNIISLFDYNYVCKLLSSKNICSINFSNTNELYKTIKRLISIKKTKLCYHCSLTNIKDIIREVDNIGKKIIILKICSNKIENFNITYGNALYKLSQNHNFIILNDLGLYNSDHINLDNYRWCNAITTYNIDIKCNFYLVYINKNNKNITNNKIIGVIHNDNNYVNYINISETINTITELKELKINKYDIISINSSCCNENVIQYINSK